MKNRIVSITSSRKRRPFGKPAPALFPPPVPVLALEKFRRRKSPFTTATCARIPMLVSLVPSALSVAIMSPANLPFASSVVSAKLYSSLRANGISATLIAGFPIRSMVVNPPVLVKLPSLAITVRRCLWVWKFTPMTFAPGLADVNCRRKYDVGMLSAIACTL